ncbi:MAG: hypothetical protein JRI55_04000 [Deltaproteobacteria bacterium]|nr:hypothetical protein [Deltaproteobacteria bacterium]
MVRSMRWLVRCLLAGALALGATQLLAACDRGRMQRPTGSATSAASGPGASNPAPQPAKPAGPSARLTPADLAYQGAIRLPDAFDWGARGLAFAPGDQGGSLLVLGHDQRPAEFARVSIPAPAKSRDLASLPRARMLDPMRNFDGSIVEGVNEVAPFASGIELVPKRGSQKTDKLYGAIDNWYGVVDESHATIWMSEPDGSSPRGPFHVGPRKAPFHGNRAGSFLFAVPAWYADAYLGGRTLVTGKARGAFGGSQGPSLFAFRPWDADEPTGNLDAVAMLYYRIRYPECAGPNVGDPKRCDFPGFTMCDEWEGASFLEHGAKRAIVIVGKKGLGPNHYGEPPRAGTCESDKGYHCDPYERQVLLYDVDELGAAAQGKREPWTVLPYATWRPKELLVQGPTCGQVGGVAFDPASRRLFVIEKGLGDNNSAAVHLWLVGR